MSAENSITSGYFGYVTKVFIGPNYSRITTGDPLVSFLFGSESRVFSEFNLSSAPPAASIDSASLLITTGSNVAVGATFGVYSLGIRPTTGSDSDLWNDIDGTQVSSEFTLGTASEAKELTLNTSGLDALKSAILAEQEWFALGISSVSGIGFYDATISRASSVVLSLSLFSSYSRSSRYRAHRVRPRWFRAAPLGRPFLSALAA